MVKKDKPYGYWVYRNSVDVRSPDGLQSELIAGLNWNQMCRVKKLSKAVGMNLDMAFSLALNIGLSELKVTHGSAKADRACMESALRGLTSRRIVK